MIAMLPHARTCKFSTRELKDAIGRMIGFTEGPNGLQAIIVNDQGKIVMVDTPNVVVYSQKEEMAASADVRVGLSP